MNQPYQIINIEGSYQRSVPLDAYRYVQTSEGYIFERLYEDFYMSPDQTHEVSHLIWHKVSVHPAHIAAFIAYCDLVKGVYQWLLK